MEKVVLLVKKLLKSERLKEICATFRREIGIGTTAVVIHVCILNSNSDTLQSF
jgi:hypothetical protein